MAGVATTAVNTVGAGDAFCAALVIALHSGMTPTAALQTAASSISPARSSRDTLAPCD